MQLEGLGKLKKKCNDLIRNRTRDLTTCSKVSQLLTECPNLLLYGRKSVLHNISFQSGETRLEELFASYFGVLLLKVGKTLTPREEVLKLFFYY
jgi:hypothetical protein